MRRDTAAGLAIAGTLVVLAVLGPAIATDPLVQPDLAHGALRAPSWSHPLGTDQYSRDVFARLAHGAVASLLVALIAVSVAAALGVIIGLAAGSARDPWAGLLRRGIDLGLSLPRIVVLLVMLASVGELPLVAFAIVIGLTGWPAIARLVRGETLRLRHAEYVMAARALGATPPRVLRREVFPGAVTPALVAATLGVADAVLLEAGLSFLGLGIRPPLPSWGGMILESRDHLHSAPWLLLFPVAALVAATTAATLLGESLRRSLQPDTR